MTYTQKSYRPISPVMKYKFININRYDKILLLHCLKRSCLQLELVASLMHRSVDARVFSVLLRIQKHQIMSKK